MAKLNGYTKIVSLIMTFVVIIAGGLAGFYDLKTHVDTTCAIQDSINQIAEKERTQIKADLKEIKNAIQTIERRQYIDSIGNENLKEQNNQIKNLLEDISEKLDK